jgi:hypothetical protein
MEVPPTDNRRANDQLFGLAHCVMPAHGNVHGFNFQHEGKSWMPTFVGTMG